MLHSSQKTFLPLIKDSFTYFSFDTTFFFFFSFCLSCCEWRFIRFPIKFQKSTLLMLTHSLSLSLTVNKTCIQNKTFWFYFTETCLHTYISYKSFSMNKHCMDFLIRKTKEKNDFTSNTRLQSSSNSNEIVIQFRLKIKRTNVWLFIC